MKPGKDPVSMRRGAKTSRRKTGFQEAAYQFFGNSKRFETWLVRLMAITLMIGLIGYLWFNLPQCEDSKTTWCHLRASVNSVVQTLQLFTLGTKIETIAADNWFLTFARLFGALVGFAAIGAVLYKVFRSDIEAAWIARLADHWIICGYDDNSWAFCESCCRGERARILVIDRDPDGTVEAACRRQHYFFVKGAAEEAGIIAAIGLDKAAGMIISGPDDEAGVAICRAAGAHLEKLNSGPLDVVLVLEDIRLIEHMERDRTFLTRLGARLDVMLFNLARQTAIALCERTPFVDLALRRQQNRVHLAVFGDTPVAVETIVQFLRISPAIGLETPRIDWFCENRDRLMGNLTHRNEVLGALAGSRGKSGAVETADAPLAWALELHVHELPAGGDVPGLDAMKHVEAASQCGPTAIVVAVGEGARNMSIGLSLRDRAQRQQIWAAPLFVHMRHETSLDGFLQIFCGDLARDVPDALRHLKSTEEPAQVIEPFGAVAGLCGLQNLRGQREKVAQRIHQAYLRTREAKSETGDRSDPRDESLRPWDILAETYKQANRRAADHFPVKMESVGVRMTSPLSPKSLPAEVLDDADRFEKLASIEHDSWRIDRELDGWRQGTPRDNSRKIHTDLVAYDDLSERIKDYDREQIRLLTRL